MINQTPETMVNAINRALCDAMTHDQDIVLLGEDIAAKGGVFGVTRGLLADFGPERVIDTPLAEVMLAGISVGLASQGIKPVVEFQFSGFILAALEQIACHAARLRSRTRGRLSCPVVFRAPYGGGIHGPEHHCESPEALFAHLPGLRVVIPSSPAKAYSLLLSSIADPDPVIFLEPKRVYRTIREPLPPTNTHYPLDRCFILRYGRDVTLISWGALIQETLTAEAQLQQQGIHCDVIDVATIKPLDIDTIAQSVRKTGRCLIIHEAVRTGGVGAEIAAQISTLAFPHLKTPPIRKAGFDVITPYCRLEPHFMIQPEHIVQSVIQLMNDDVIKKGLLQVGG
ncbi:alpha-ketoacid dehydrogenase subunit beta [Endozoicomonas sp. SCSIO W0465]|uniref:alpha-ketoacid dehydrogenase subunit beta n=1 Tax=Endozoicomonas sp. SCSIO W0465 TaxID=2918516 RepID=UPI00207650C1|nr:alpha-ketoacid dehydrogenase subunit beta [Endozoicomonas sp. SCSIO W0465]USE35960.1 alpha-ketoacid dehydrogenase subunit beta [Endozoicomonas sp. SCSIO W0465]